MNRRLCFHIWGGGQGGRSLPSRPLSPSSLLGAARAKFSFFPSFQIFSPLFLLPPLFSLLPSRLLPLTLSAPSIFIWLQRGRRFRCVRLREGTVDVLRSTPGRDKDVMLGRGIDERKLNLKGGGGRKRLRKDKGVSGRIKTYPLS